MYLQKVLDANLGFTDKELEKYYKSHTDSYKMKMQVDVPPAPKAPQTPKTSAAKAKDTSKTKVTPPQTVKKDTVIQRTLAEVKDQVLKALFLAKYPVPDSLFKQARSQRHHEG